MRERVTPFRVLVGMAVALLATIIILYEIPTNEYIYAVDAAHPVAPYVQVQGAHPAGTGQLFFVDVHEVEANELQLLLRDWLYPHSTLVPAREVVPRGSTSDKQLHAAFREMASSQRTAAAVALDRLGYDVFGPDNGVFVDNVYFNVPAAAKVYPADVIVAANGRPTMSVAELHAAVALLKPGQVVSLQVRRGAHILDERVKTFRDPNNPKRALIGVLVEQSRIIKKLPVKVSIDVAGVGGPSAGLPFTLEVLHDLGTDVTHGYKVAATGEIQLDGRVTAIGGVKQKTWGARDAGAQVFLVPVDGGNATEAKKYAGPNLKLIPVTSLAQGLKALRALPKLP